MSWEDINKPGQTAASEEKKKLQKDKDRQLQRDFLGTFGSQQGRRVLKFLRDRTIERSTFVLPGSGTDGLTMQKLQDMREGENNIVRLIEGKLKQGGIEL